MISSKYSPVPFTLNQYPIEEVKNTDAFISYLNQVFPKLSKEDQYKLLKEKLFVTYLFTSGPKVFRDFSLLHFHDKNIVLNLFSQANKKIISKIDKTNVSDCLSYLMSYKNCYDILLEDDNYYILENDKLEYGFVTPLIQYAYENNPSLATDFATKHPEFIIRNNLYRQIKVSNPITSSELELLFTIKKKLNVDDESRFYSYFSIETINSIIDSGHYNLLSNKDKKHLINNTILYINTNETPLTINLFKNKDFFENIIKSIGDDSIKIVDTLKYIKMYLPEIYDTYDKLFKAHINKKEIKDINDICYLYFDDYFENVTYNIEIIKEYAKSNPLYKEKLNSREFKILMNLDFSSLQTFDDYSDFLFELEHSKIDYAKLIYECISLARDTFIDDIKNSLSSPNKDKIESTIVEGVKVYKYDGQDLSFIVHCAAEKTGDPKEFASSRSKYINRVVKDLYLSTSYINQNNINVYRDSAIIFGFNDLKNMKLVSANYQDAFTSNNSLSPINHPSTYQNIDEFSKHQGYSELLFKPTGLNPDYIVCFDKPDIYDLEMAKILNLNIVCINSKAYKNNNLKLTDILNKYYKQ